MDALIIIALAVIVVVVAFHFLGIGKARTIRHSKAGTAYSKRPRHKK